MARNKAYREAEKKIEEARRSGATKLDLSNYGKDKLKLTELPESLGQLTQLQSLDLSQNQLTALPEWLGRLKRLQTLNLSENKLTVLPESLGNLRQLQSLELINNQLMALPRFLTRLQHLKKLNLYHNRIDSLPDWINQLQSLESIALGGNNINSLPDSIVECNSLRYLNLGDYGGGNPLRELPEQIGRMRFLTKLNVGNCQLQTLPQWIENLKELRELGIHDNPIGSLPNYLQSLVHLEGIWASNCDLYYLPDWLGGLKKLSILSVQENHLKDLPSSLAQLKYLEELNLGENPLNPELAAADEQGLDAVKAYLRAKAGAQITLNEAKLILVGEGEVGKTCLMDALEGAAWQEHDTTHGIEIRSVQAVDPESGTEITLNGWDFGGQRVYRPTHQLFFSSPAVYLVVWKPREGPQQGFVKEWIKLVKHREPDAKILVVATHGGPQQRQPDIDRQELWDLFGKETVIDFFHVESKPDKKGKRRGIKKLKRAIARVASTLPEVGREVPQSFQDARQALQETGAAYLPLGDVLDICRAHQMDDEVARLFVTISHRLGHFIHYEHDAALRDIVVLKPDWLAAAISFVLDDEATRTAHGLAPSSRLSQLWNDPTRAEEFRYPAAIHPIFLRLMERYDLSYRVAGLLMKDESDSTSLIAQLVPDTRPEAPLESAWPLTVTSGDTQQVQICRIVDEKGQSATAEGLFYQLIVRLHKFSLGRANYDDSVHWQRGLVLDDDYNGLALLEHIGNDVRITVRAPYPERFLAMLTSEVKYLVESFWEGLRCDVMVPCITPCGINDPGAGLYEVGKLIGSKRKNRPEYPCPVCNEWQDIDHLLRNAPAVRPVATAALLAEFDEVKRALAIIYQKIQEGQTAMVGGLAQLDANDQRLLSRIDDAYDGLLRALTDEAKEGPRLFSFEPVDRSNFNPKKWTSAKFRLTLWCEHSQLPLPALNGPDSKKGVYEIELTRAWFKKAAPLLKVLIGTLSLVLPMASSGLKLVDQKAYEAIEDQLAFGKDIIDASLSGGEKVGEWLGGGDSTSLEHGEAAIRAQGATLRELQALLKAKDPGFGGLVRVRNKRQEFLWVHPQFEEEY